MYIETRPRPIARETYFMFMKKYGLPHTKRTTSKKMAQMIYDYELKHAHAIKVGLYVNGKFFVQYANQFGDGPKENIGFVTPTSIPDAPILVSVVEDDHEAVITWQAPAFTGQSVITAYKIYINGNLINTASSSATSYTAQSLTNGVSYTFWVAAVNSVGQSENSDSLAVIPYGQMSIVSASAAGKTLTLVVNPNGRPITSVIMMGVDSNWSSADGNPIVTIPQGQIPQSASSNVTVVKTFSAYDTDLAFWAVIAINDIGTDARQSV